MSKLSEVLSKRIEEVSAAVAGDLLVECGLDPAASKALISGESVCPPLSTLRACSEALGVDFEDLRAAAEADGCEYDAEGFSISCPLSRRIKVAERESVRLKKGIAARATAEREAFILKLFAPERAETPAAESVQTTPEEEAPEKDAEMESLWLRGSRGDMKALAQYRKRRIQKQKQA